MSEASAVTAGKDVAALVVAADSGGVLEDCVAALLSSAAVSAVRVADNASRDGVPQRMAAVHAADARFELVVNATNLGFGAAINRLATAVDAAWLAIVNPDCVVTSDALDALLAVARRDDAIGLVGACIVDPEGRTEPASQRRDPELRRVLATLGFARGDGVNSVADTPGVVDVDAVSGALMLVRRSLFASLGGFDEGYFLHFEDLDLCRRVRDAGSRVVLAADVQVVHGKGSSSRHRAVFVDWHKHRGMWRWFRQHDPLARRALAKALVWAGIHAHFLAKMPLMAWRSWRARRGR